MKKINYFILFFGLLFLSGLFLVVSPKNVANATVEKVSICHNADGVYKFMDTPAGPSLSGHLGHGDFVYTGGNDENKDLWCENHKPTPPEDPKTATITATKIVCDSEIDLPNWGAGNGPDITKDTATDYVATSQGKCKIVPWTFEWALAATNPGDNIQSGGEGWTSFTETADIPDGEGKTVWAREQMDDNYIPFSGDITDPRDDNVSAEFYCNKDHLNYDNYDYISNPVAGQSYYCVGFNVLKEKPKQCNIVSDTTNIVENGGYAVETWNGHTSWIQQTVLGNFAKWIWDKVDVANPTMDEEKVFIKTFSVSGTVDTAVIKLAADNGYKLEINNVTVDNKLGIEDNFSPAAAPQEKDVKSFLINGENTIRFTVKNFAQAGGTSKTNPAGLLYNLEINVYGDCSPSEDVPSCEEGKHFDVDTNSCIDNPVELICNPNVNLIQNGDFEQPALVNPSWDIIPDSNPLLKWLVAWVGSPTDGRLGLEIQNHVAGDPSVSGGLQFAELDGDHPVKIWQDIATIPGKTYNLNFDYSARPGIADNKIEVKADGSVLGAVLSADGSTNSNTVWTPETRSFVATGSTTKVEFVDTSADTSTGGYLDNVGLYCQTDVEETPSAITNPAGDITSTSTTINGTNGNVVATDEAFWYGQTTGGPFVPAVGDASSQYPAGWVGVIASTKNLAAGGTFSLSLSGLTPDTTYYFVAWSLVDGTWYPGDVLSFTTAKSENPTTEYTFTVTSTGTGSGTVGGGGEFDEGTIQTATESPNADSYFSGWVEAGCPTVTINGPKSCTATFTAKTPVCTDERANNYVGVMSDTEISNVEACTYGTHRWCAVQNDESYKAVAIPNNQSNPNGKAWITGMDAYCIMDACPNMEGHQSSVTECPTPTEPVLGCMDKNANNYNPLATQDNNTCKFTLTHHSLSGSIPQLGQVLGAETSCGIYVDKFLKKGLKGNDKEAVSKVQKFLNDYMGFSLAVDSKFGEKTDAALKAFQAKHADKILDPWGLKKPTGIFYLTTQTEVNNIMCPTLGLPIPQLTPLDQNPAFPNA